MVVAADSRLHLLQDSCCVEDLLFAPLALALRMTASDSVLSSAAASSAHTTYMSWPLSYDHTAPNQTLCCNFIPNIAGSASMFHGE